MGLRRQAREFALKMLFQIDLGELEAAEVIPYFLSGEKATPEVISYAKVLTHGVLRDQANIDRLISQCTHHWKLTRLAGVDRNVLRIATYELLHCPDVPAEVILNEAIEIAKKYSTEASGAFVNGILDQINSHQRLGNKKE